MKLSIVIPVYNEEKTVGELITKVKLARLPNGISKEIIVVNDGSTDQTTQILAGIKIPNLKIINLTQNCGKGYAIRQGLKKISGNFVIIQDADLEYNPADFSKLLAPLVKESASVVYGTRLNNYPLKLWGDNRTPLPTHWIGNKFLTWLTNLLYGSNLTDMETCYKMLTKKVIDGLNLRSNRFDFEPEITAKILKMGYTIFEVPIKVKPRTHQEGKKIGFRDGIIAIGALIKYRLTD